MSIWQRYLKRRDLRLFRRVQGDNIANLLSAVDDEVGRMLKGDLCLKDDLARSPSFHCYCIGVLDAITSLYERETRRRFGLELYRVALADYFRERFVLARADAEALFFAAANACEANPALLKDGYADGLLVLRGAIRIDRLRAHFATPKPANDEEIGFDAAVAAAAM